MRNTVSTLCPGEDLRECGPPPGNSFQMLQRADYIARIALHYIMIYQGSKRPSLIRDEIAEESEQEVKLFLNDLNKPVPIPPPCETPPITVLRKGVAPGTPVQWSEASGRNLQGYLKEWDGNVAIIAGVRLLNAEIGVEC